MTSYIGVPLYNKVNGNLVESWLPEQTPDDINATIHPKPAGLYIYSEQEQDWIFDTATKAALDAITDPITLEGWEFEELLINNNLLPRIDEILAMNLPNIVEKRAKFKRKTTFDSNNVDLLQVGALLGLNADQIKLMFAIQKGLV